MKNTLPTSLKVLALSAAISITTACSTAANKTDGVDLVRQKLSALQADPQLASRAQVAIKEAEIATRIAEESEGNQKLAEHQVYMADHKVEIAMAIAQSRLLEDQREDLTEQREEARLNSRTNEANLARKNQLSAEKRSAELEKQLLALNAKESERGMVLTIGDVLFETGKFELKNGVSGNLDKLSLFLKKYQDRQLLIEGYTDNVGSDEFNLKLSKQRADSVKSYLLEKGIASKRMQTSGQGKSAPVATNDSTMGRQINRRVEIIISDTM